MRFQICFGQGWFRTEKWRQGGNLGFLEHNANYMPYKISRIGSIILNLPFFRKDGFAGRKEAKEKIFFHG